LEDSFEEPFGFAKIGVLSSEPGFAVSLGDDDSSGDGECILGLDTLGAKVKRGNLFAIKTININNNKAVPKVSVMVLDQTGDLNAINAESSNTGFFNERLHSDYQQGLIVQLEKEGCEPSTQIIEFDLTYNDYLKDREKEEDRKKLKFNLEESYNSNQEIKSTVTNMLDEAVVDVQIKLTKPDGATFEVENSLEDGSFVFTPDEMGIWKIQGTRDNYESTELIELNIMSSDYVIVKTVDGKEKFEFKKGDIIIFEIKNEEDEIIPLTFEADIGGESVSFLDGVSEEYTFEKEERLEIPQVGGYEEYSITLRKDSIKWGSWIFWICIIIGLVIIILIIRKIIKKRKGGSGVAPKQVQFELQPGQE